MKKFQILSIIAILFTTFACEKEIEFNGEIQDKKVVVNSFAVADSILTAEIFYSKFFLDNKIGFDTIKNAEVLLYVNGNYKTDLTFQQVDRKAEDYMGGYTYIKGLYLSNYRPQPGDSLELRIQVDGFDEITAQTFVPKRADFDQNDIKVRVDTTSAYESSYMNENNELVSYFSYSLQVYYSIKFKDEIDEKNFYRIILRNSYGSTEWLESDDPIFNQTGEEGIFDLIDGSSYNYFADETFNGETRTITFNSYSWSDSWGNNDTNKFLDVQQMSKEAYLYMKTAKSAELNEGNIFSEPVLTFSNVKGGIGIFAAITKSAVPVNLNLDSLLNK